MLNSPDGSGIPSSFLYEMDIADSRRNVDEEWKTSAPKFFIQNSYKWKTLSVLILKGGAHSFKFRPNENYCFVVITKAPADPRDP